MSTENGRNRLTSGKAESTADHSEPALTPTEWALIHWVRSQCGGVAHVAAMTPNQQKALSEFVLAMRESNTVH